MILDEPYMSWLDGEKETSIYLFHKGNGGVVYHTSWFQDPKIHDTKVFLDICPIADDVWFNLWRMKHCAPRCMIQKSLDVPIGLFQTNESKNDAIIKAVHKYIFSY
jgi:hypothetical protein